jgi:hypothetical protein
MKKPLSFRVDVEVPPSPCLGCGKINDMSTGPQRPDPGDITVCFSCGHIMVFAEDLSVRNPNDAEMMIIAGDKRILQIQTAREIVHTALKEERKKK